MINEKHKYRLIKIVNMRKRNVNMQCKSDIPMVTRPKLSVILSNSLDLDCYIILHQLAQPLRVMTYLNVIGCYIMTTIATSVIKELRISITDCVTALLVMCLQP